MASNPLPVERKGEIESISPENHPETLLPENTDTHSVNLEVENLDSDLEEETDSPPTRNRRSSFLTCYMPIPKKLYYLMFCLFCLCVVPVAYALITVFTAAILPLLLVTFIVLRFFQFAVTGQSYIKHYQLMVLLRCWILVVVILLVTELCLFYLFAKNVSGLKLVMIMGLSIENWIKEVICIVIGIYLLDQFLWTLLTVIVIQGLSLKDRKKNITIIESTSEIISCLLLWFAVVVVMSSIPTFEQSKIFGIYTRDWTKVSLLVLIGHNIIRLLANILVWSLSKIGDYLVAGGNVNHGLKSLCCASATEAIFSRKNMGYVGIGMKRSIIFILSMTMLLITWVVYFGNRLDKTPRNKRILEIGTWSFVSLLICSFLWLFKSCIIMYWEAHTVYDRLHPKIRDIGKQLYFLIMLSYMHYKITMKHRMKDSEDSDCGLSCCKTPPKKIARWILPYHVEGYTHKKIDRRRVRADLIDRTSKNASIYDLHKAAQRCLTAQHALSNEKTIGDIHHLLGNEPEDSNAKCIEVMQKIVQVEGDPYFDKDWEMLLKLLPDVKTTADITFDRVKTFMDRAHSRCMFLTNTLISENEVVKCLNQAISGLIIGVTFIMWLLLSGLATTQVLVLIVSPLLAATFIFGDTAKNLFQGLIFIYIAHPFDTGDLCIIDEKLLEVNRIGIWSTIFSNVRSIGEQQHIIYPNSVLAMKDIINHKTNFNWNDNIEFLCSPDKKITEPLIHTIQTYLNDEKKKFTPNFHSVEILEIGEKAKISVHVKYKLPTTEGWTHFECLKEKEKRKLEFAMYVQDLLKPLDSEKETSVIAESAVAESAQLLHNQQSQNQHR